MNEKKKNNNQKKPLLKTKKKKKKKLMNTNSAKSSINIINFKLKLKDLPKKSIILGQGDFNYFREIIIQNYE